VVCSEIDYDCGPWSTQAEVQRKMEAQAAEDAARIQALSTKLDERDAAAQAQVRMCLLWKGVLHSFFARKATRYQLCSRRPLTKAGLSGRRAASGPKGTARRAGRAGRERRGG
jgi:hypothetical protein